MSSRTSSSSSQSSEPSGDDSIDSHLNSDNPSSTSDMLYGTVNLKKGGAAVTQQNQTLQTSDLNKSSWAKEIEGKISVVDAPVATFLDVYVPKSTETSPAVDLTGVFWDVDTTGKEDDMYEGLIKALGVVVQGFEPDKRPAFNDNSHFHTPFPFEAWGKEQHYTMPDIVMSLPGNSDAEWAQAWPGISTIFEVKLDKSKEDPVNERDCTIKTSALSITTLIQLAKSARNLLHTHRLLYAFVIGIYDDKARIYRFDHAAGVVSKAIDLKKDPYPLYDFLWRFCHYRHPDPSVLSPPPHIMVPLPAQPPYTTSQSTTPTLPISGQPRRSAKVGCFLGADPTIFPASEADCREVDKRLRQSNPPQSPLTEEERGACRWVAIVTAYNKDGSAKEVKWYITYRLRFFNPRLFSRATAVREAYDGHTWEQRAIKDAWRQLARDREDVLYRRLRDHLLARNDLRQLVEECKKFGLPVARSDDAASDDDDSASASDESASADDEFRNGPPPPSSSAGNESEYELDDDEETSVLADESNLPLFALPDVEVGCDLGAHEARRLFDSKHSGQPTGASSPSEADLDSIALGELHGPPVYGVYHRTICAWLRGEREEVRFNERSHMRLVLKTVGRPLSSFKSTKELVTAIRDAIIGHMLAFKAGLIHRDLSDGNVLIHDGGLFTGFLLDLDYAFDWMEALRLSGRPVDEAAWETHVAEYNAKVANIERLVHLEQTIPPLIPGRPTQSSKAEVSWVKRMQMKERTGTLFFMAIEVLKTYVAHDVRHDLESAIWLLFCMVLRHTLQTDAAKRVYIGVNRYALYLQRFSGTNEMDSSRAKAEFGSDAFRWEVKDNKRLTDLLHDLQELLALQTHHQALGPLVPLTYESILTAFNRSLAMPDWPENDAALPFTLPVDGKGSSGSNSRKHSLEEDDENEAGRGHDKKLKPSPLRNTFGP